MTSYHCKTGKHRIGVGAVTYRVGGHPAPAGRVLPNLINAVSILKSKAKTQNAPTCDGAFEIGLANSQS